MKVTITFEKSDIFLAAAIRGLVSQIEGYQRVKGQTNVAMMMLDSLEFDFKGADQANRFEKVVRTYIAEKFQSGMKIEISSN